MLHKDLPEPSHILSSLDIQLEENLSYEEKLVAIVDKQVKKFHWKEVPLVKVIWRNHSIEEATC